MSGNSRDEARRESPRALAAELFGSDARVGCAEIATADVRGLYPTEASAIRAAIDARKREFAAGRAAARKALGRSVAIPVAEDRAPVWPLGVAASITHAGGWALAAAGLANRMIGVDLEVDEPLPQDVFDTVLTQAERTWVNEQSEPGIWARVIFSAKECAYKAQYPRSRQLFGFEVFELNIDIEAGNFTAVFQADIAKFATGDKLQGRFLRRDGFILTGIVA